MSNKDGFSDERHHHAITSTPSSNGGLKMKIKRNSSNVSKSSTPSSFNTGISPNSPKLSFEGENGVKGIDDVISTFSPALSESILGKTSKLEALLKETYKSSSVEEVPQSGISTNSRNPMDSASENSTGGHLEILPNEMATMTEQDNLGPCEPGTAVKLQGIVWKETERGLLVLNVTWKGKTYMGTLLDCNRQSEAHKWGPPPDPNAIKGRGAKRNRNNRSRTPPVKGASSSGKRNKKQKGGKKLGFSLPISPLTKDSSLGLGKRKAALNALSGLKDREDEEESNDSNEDDEDEDEDEYHKDRLIECPKNDCSKKFKDLEALKFHLSYAHSELKKRNSASTSSLSSLRKDTTAPDIEEEETNNNKENGSKTAYSTSRVSPAYSDISDEDSEGIKISEKLGETLDSVSPSRIVVPSYSPNQLKESIKVSTGGPILHAPPPHGIFPFLPFSPGRQSSYSPRFAPRSPFDGLSFRGGLLHRPPINKAFDLLQIHASQILSSTSSLNPSHGSFTPRLSSPHGSSSSSLNPSHGSFTPRLSSPHGSSSSSSIYRHEHSHTHLHYTPVVPVSTSSSSSSFSESGTRNASKSLFSGPNIPIKHSSHSSK